MRKLAPRGDLTDSKSRQQFLELEPSCKGIRHTGPFWVSAVVDAPRRDHPPDSQRPLYGTSGDSPDQPARGCRAPHPHRSTQFLADPYIASSPTVTLEMDTVQKALNTGHNKEEGR